MPLTKDIALAKMASMATTDYDRLKEALDRKYRLDLEAIERVRRMEEELGESTVISSANGHADSPLPSAKTKKKTSEVRKNKGKVISAVRKIVGGLQGEFTRQAIEESLRADYPHLDVKPGSLKAVLKRMAETGEIRVIVAAQGRRHAKYRRGMTLD